VSLRKIKGEGWIEYVKALAKQAPLLKESFAPVPNDIVRGEVMLGFTYLQYVYQNKGPLGYVLMDKILTDTNDLGLNAKATNPNAAKLYMEYLCSPEGQKLVADLGEFVLSPGVYPPIASSWIIPRAKNTKSSAPSSARFFSGNRVMISDRTT
jgi:ABC-type Fe3+ transport system substrate-binding protein